MDVAQIFAEFETLKTDRQRKYYLSQGAQEPVLGVPTGAMKPIAKLVKNNQAIADNSLIINKLQLHSNRAMARQPY